MRPTMDDVAAAASVSKSTVSRALSGDPRVKPETRRRILQIAAELGYTPDYSASALAHGQTWMIGVATPGVPRGFSDPFYLEFLGGLGDGAMRAGYNLLIAAPSEREPQDAPSDEAAPSRAARTRGVHLAGLIARRAVDAVVLTEPAENDPRLPLLRRYGLPFAFLGTCEENGQVAEGVSFVDGDNIGGARAAVEHLIALGHRRIACIAGAAGLVSTRHRLEGFRRAMAAAGLPVDERWIVDGESTRQGGRRAMRALIEMGLGRDEEAPTAVFACNDVMAIGAMVAAREAGLSVPGDVSIAGFDGIALSELVDPPLTTVQQPIYELGKTLAEVLLDVIEHSRKTHRRARKTAAAVPAEGPGRGRTQGHADGYVRREILPCRLVVRGTTAPPKGALEGGAAAGAGSLPRSAAL